MDGAIVRVTRYADRASAGKALRYGLRHPIGIVAEDCEWRVSRCWEDGSKCGRASWTPS